MHLRWNSLLEKKSILVAGFLTASSVFCLALRLKNLGTLSLWMDEGFYYLAAQRILESGYPLLPSGHILFKGILYSYLLSAFSVVFGFNEVSLRVFSVICSVATIPVLYLVGKKFAGKSIAFISIIILIFSSWETEYSRLVLYFAPLQLIYLLGLLFFYQGFFENKKKYKWLTLVSFILAPLVHQLGMGLWFCFPALFLIRGAKKFFKKDILLVFLSISLFYVLVQVHETFFWKVGYVYVKSVTSFREMMSYFFTSFSLNYFKELFKSFPHMSLLILAGFFLFVGEFAIKKERNGGDRSHIQVWYFLNLCLIFPLVFFGFFRTHIQPRYLFQLRPVVILLFATAAWKISGKFILLALSPYGLKNKAVLPRLLSTGIFLLLVFLFTDQAGLGKVKDVIHRDYTDKIETDIITRSGRSEHYDHRDVGQYVRHYSEKDDIVIAIHVVFQYIYAGHVDYWLWSGGPGTWDAWEKTAEGWKDVYIGARWVNTLGGLKKIIEENPQKRIWLITSPSVRRTDHINQDIATFIESNEDKLVFRGKDQMSAVYVWHEKDQKLAGTQHAWEAEWLPETFGRIVYEPEASKGAALFLDKGRDKYTFMSFILPKKYPAGHYKFILRLKTDDTSIARTLMGIGVFARMNDSRISSNFLAGRDFRMPSEYQNFEFNLYLDNDEDLLVKIPYLGGANIWLDWFDLVPLEREKR